MIPTHSPTQSGRFQVLALDGGGIKGLFSAAVLAAIEEDLDIVLTNHFDLITGTSTGGIIALGLGLGRRPREIVEFYVNKGPRIFRNRFGFRGWLHLFRRKFPQGRFETALREQDAFGETLLGDSQKRLVIPSYNLSEDDVYLFKTPHHERLRRDWKVPAWKVALATSAAPTYFPACRRVGQIRLVDGGVWANNPTMVGIVEAVSMLGVPLETIRVLSLGTTNSVVDRKPSLDNGGLWRWRTAGIDVVMRGQSIGAYTQAQHLLGKKDLERLDPVVPDGIYHLDKVTPDGLIGLAAHHSRHFAPTFKAKFADHLAAPYEPYYSTKENGDKLP